MPFDSALSAGELVSLRGNASTAAKHQAEVYLSVCPNTNTYTARVNATPDTYPVVDITYDGGSGTLSDVRAGMTVLISHTNDRFAAFFRGYVRKTPTATVLYVGANGDSADITNDDFVFVLDDYAIHEKLPRDVGGAPVPDWDVTWRRLQPLIYDLPSVVVGYVNSVSTKLTWSATPTVLKSDADSTTSYTYLWEYPAGAAITVGADSDKNVTFDFNAGFDSWVHFTATDSNGVTHTRHIKVWAHDDNNPPAPMVFSDLSISCERPIDVSDGSSMGYNGTVKAFDGVSAILDHTLVVSWVVQKYNGTSTNIGSSGNVILLGRIRTETNQVSYPDGQQDDSIEYSIEGPLTQLSSRRFPPIEILRATAPDSWNEVEGLTVWRAIHLILSEYSSFEEIHSLGFGSTGDDHQLPVGYATQGGDLLYSVADLAQSINAIIQDSQSGEIEVVQRAIMLADAGRNALATIVNLTNSDYEEITVSRDPFHAIGSLMGSGGGYHSSDSSTNVYEVQAPRGYPGSGASDGQLHRQVLVADQTVTTERTEMELRAGHAYAAQQAPETIAAKLNPGYHFLLPSVDQWYTFTIAAGDTTGGKVYSTSIRWWLQSKSVDAEPSTGTLEHTYTFVRETIGVPGKIIDRPLIDLGLTPNMPELDDLVMETPTVDTDINIDFDDGVGDGTRCGDNWCTDCVDDKSVINLTFPLDDIYSIKTVSITYTATANVASPANKLYLWVSGNFRAPVYLWTTVSGANQTITVDCAGIKADRLGVELYGDGDSCDDTITLTHISFTVTERETFGKLSYDFTDGQQHGWSLAFPGDASIWSGTGWADNYPTTTYDGAIIKSPALPAMAIYKVVIHTSDTLDGPSPLGQWSHYPDQSPYYKVNSDASPNNQIEVVGALTLSDGESIIAQIDGHDGGTTHIDQLLTGVDIYYTNV
jgi:hypothetical protein